MSDGLEAGLLSIAECPVCSRNMLAAFNRADILLDTEPWVPEFCPEHSRSVTLSFDDLETLRSGGCVVRDGVFVYFD